MQLAIPRFQFRFVPAMGNVIHPGNFHPVGAQVGAEALVDRALQATSKRPAAGAGGNWLLVGGSGGFGSAALSSLHTYTTRCNFVNLRGEERLQVQQLDKLEAAFREEVLLAVVAIPLGLWLGQGGIEKALLVGSILLILIVELLNSAVEAVVDRVSGEHHELSKRAKDIGSAAVLITLLLAAAVWALILVPHYL